MSAAAAGQNSTTRPSHLRSSTRTLPHQGPHHGQLGLALLSARAPAPSTSCWPELAPVRGNVVAQARRKWYAIFEPATARGVYKVWEHVQLFVSGYSNARHKGFHSEAAALGWLQDLEIQAQEQEGALDTLRQQVLETTAAAARAAAAVPATSAASSGPTTLQLRSRAARIAARTSASPSSATTAALPASTSDVTAPTAAVTGSPMEGGQEAGYGTATAAGATGARPWETSPIVLHVPSVPTREYYRKWYAVRFVDGGCPGVYNTWQEAEAAINGRYSEYKSFGSHAEALTFAFGPLQASQLLAQQQQQEQQQYGHQQQQQQQQEQEQNEQQGPQASWEEQMQQRQPQQQYNQQTSWEQSQWGQGAEPSDLSFLPSLSSCSSSSPAAATVGGSDWGSVLAAEGYPPMEVPPAAGAAVGPNSCSGTGPELRPEQRHLGDWVDRQHHYPYHVLSQGLQQSLALEHDRHHHYHPQQQQRPSSYTVYEHAGPAGVTSTSSDNQEEAGECSSTAGSSGSLRPAEGRGRDALGGVLQGLTEALAPFRPSVSFRPTGAGAMALAAGDAAAAGRTSPVNPRGAGAAGQGRQAWGAAAEPWLGTAATAFATAAARGGGRVLPAPTLMSMVPLPSSTATTSYIRDSEAAATEALPSGAVFVLASGEVEQESPAGRLSLGEELYHQRQTREQLLELLAASEQEQRRLREQLTVLQQQQQHQDKQQKRGRGRPRRVTQQEEAVDGGGVPAVTDGSGSTAASPVDGSEASEAAVWSKSSPTSALKRGPGRPRKPTAVVVHAVGPKRGRGRPRKVPVQAAEAAAAMTVERSRGRPRKDNPQAQGPVVDATVVAPSAADDEGRVVPDVNSGPGRD